MKPLRLDDILDIDAYERIRDAYRARVIEHKKARRVAVGPQVGLTFEDRETVRYQIQEMTRVERIRDPAKVQVEVDVYNDLVPAENELSATLFIEIPELGEIQPALDRLIGIDEHVSLELPREVREQGSERIQARFDARQMEEDRISAVHYVRFALSPAQSERWRAGSEVVLRIDHPHYAHETILEPPTRASLARDLAGETPVLLDPDLRERARPAPSETLLETGRVRVRRVSAAGSPERIVVEPSGPRVSLAAAEPELLAELIQVVQAQANAMQARAGSARVRLDLQAGEPGRLAFEISALSASTSARAR